MFLDKRALIRKKNKTGKKDKENIGSTEENFAYLSTLHIATHACCNTRGVTSAWLEFGGPGEELEYSPPISSLTR